MPKACIRCQKTKFNDEFNKKTNAPDGLQPWCRDCQMAYHKARREGIQPQDDKGFNKAITFVGNNTVIVKVTMHKARWELIAFAAKQHNCKPLDLIDEFIVIALNETLQELVD